MGTGGRHCGADHVPDCTHGDARRAPWHRPRCGSECDQLDLSSTWALRQASYTTSTEVVEFSSLSGALLAQGEDDERAGAIRTGSGKRGAGAKGQRGEVDAHSGAPTAPLAGKNLASANRPGASERVGAFRRRWEAGYGWE